MGKPHIPTLGTTLALIVLAFLLYHFVLKGKG